MGWLKDQIEGPGVMGLALGTLMGVWVGLGVFVQALLILQLADVLTGLIAAGLAGTVNSTASTRGLAKKATALILVMVCAWLSANLGEELGAAFPGGQAVAASFCVTELISMLENARRTGLSLGPLERVLAAAQSSQTPKAPPGG